MKRSRIPRWILSILLIGVFPAFALQYFDDFSAGTPHWFPGPTFSLTNPAAGIYFYRSDCPTNDQTWRLNVPVGSSWQFQSDINFRSLYGSSGTASLAMAQTNFWTTLLADVTRSSTTVRVQVEYYDTAWHTVLDSGSHSSSSSAYHVILSRPGGSNFLQVTVQGTNGFLYTAMAPTISTSILDSVTVPGYRANSSVVDFSSFQFNAPVTEQSQHYLVLATNALCDLFTNYWIGDALTGHVVNTHGTDLTNTTRPVLWERGMLLNCIDDYWHFTSDPTLLQRIHADWIFTTNMFTTTQLQRCGAGSHIIAVDDTGWTARMYLQVYYDTGDTFALQQAIALINNGFSRWLDNQLGGGMWRDDDKAYKSVYQVGVVMDALRIYQATGDQTFYDRAKQCYDWMESTLLRSNVDNLYWCDYNSSGPVDQDTPEDIHEAGSVVFLGGNMAMGVLHARFYQLTGDTNYLVRAIRTANAIYNSLEVAPNGVFINDRDAMVEGTFAGDWAREVLTLPGIPPEDWSILWATADSIYANARTTNGYYGGSWSGPPDGTNSAFWAKGTIPQILSVSCSSANMILAAGQLNQCYTNIIPHLHLAPPQSGNLNLTSSGQPNWPYQLQSSTNLTTWNNLTKFYVDPVSNSFNSTATSSGAKSFFRATPLVQP